MDMHGSVASERPIVAEILKFTGPVKTEVHKGLGRTTHIEANRKLREECTKHPKNTFKVHWQWA